MAIAHHVKEDQFVIYVLRGELAPKQKPRGKFSVYWCITAMLALSEEEADQYPVTRWTFKKEMLPAVEKLMGLKSAILEWVEQEEAESRVLAVLDDRLPTLNEAVERQLEVDRQAGLL